MSDIFISYSSKDRARAKVLAGALESQGLSVWWDRKIPPGKQFSKVIKEAMDEAKCVIVLWSKESVKSEWVQNEASEGASRKILVPALIDDVEIPFEFRRIQAARLVDWEGKSPHPEFDILLEAVRAITGQSLSPQRDSEVPPRAACTITASGGAGGAISPSGEVPVNSGADQSFTITPEDGYQIDDVVVDGKSVGAVASHIFTNVTAEHTIDASFAIKTYSLTATAVDGSVTKSPDKASYNDGDEVTLQAEADAGYTFTGWSGDLAGSSNPATLIMDADKAVTASFAVNVLVHPKSTGVETQKGGGKRQKTIVLAAICIVALIVIVSIAFFFKEGKDSQPKTYSLTVTAEDSEGKVLKDPNQASYNNGETVELKPVPNPGYSFTKWSGDINHSMNPAELAMDANKSVIAHFVKTYSLTVTAEDSEGKVLKDPNQASYNNGETVELKPVPNPGYSFTKWSGDINHSMNPAELAMDANKSVIAHFVKTYSLTVTAEDSEGKVLKDPNQASYNNGETVELKPVPNPGYSFTKWSGDINHSMNPAELAMDANKSVIAHFVKTYSLTVTAEDSEGKVLKDPNQASYKHGETVTLEAVPNMESGYIFTNWSDDLSGSENPAMLVMDSDKSVTASFALKTYSLDTPPPAVSGSVTKNPDKASYNHNETVTLEAVPNTGYIFTNWSGDLSGSTNPATLVMDADKLVTASFALKAPDVITNSIGMKLVYIPSGEFMMGSGSSAAQLAREYDIQEEVFADEFPHHKVHISEGFWMGQTEVTQGQYESVMNAKPWSGKSFVREDADYPAVYVTWEDANDFCNKLSQQEGKTYRLPTEAEWEYACRAGTKTRFSFGDSDSSLYDHAWFWDNTYEKGQDYAHSVGQEKANPWDLYDMHGNVWEWCSDRYAEDYYANGPSVDPNGPSSGATRSLRGGSWANTETYLRCSCRDGYDPDVVRDSVGFRVVCEE